MNEAVHSDTAINLLVIDASPNGAEAFVSTLRNADFAIHPTVVTREDELIDVLEEEQPDLILFSANPEGLDFAGNLKRCLLRHPRTPLIVIYREIDPEKLLQSMRDGARDVVASDDPEHLQLVFRREYGDLLTRRKLQFTERELLEAEKRCQILVENSRDAIAYIHEGMHMNANSVYLEMFGYVDMDEIEGMPILDMISPKDHQRCKSFLRNLDAENSELDITCVDRDENTFEAKLEFSPATYDGEPCTQITIRDYTQNKELEEKIELLSNRDTLTGMMNRQYFMEQMDHGIAPVKERNGDCTLFYLTLDGYQQTRADIGIIASDSLLKEVSEIIAGIFEGTPLIARFGDHTFAIFSEQNNKLNAEATAECLRETIASHPFQADEKLHQISCSIGIAFLESDIYTSQEFINHAYQACENARNEGGNGFSLYDSSEMEASYGEDDQGNEARINQLIQHALENDRFRLVYQPIVSLQGDSRENYAVLTRLLDHNDEEILPNYFMKYAEQGRQMAEVDRWVIRHTIEELSNQRKKGRKVNFFVNLSGAALVDEGLLLWLCDRLKETKAKGSWLTFQIKDSDLRNNIQSAKKLISGLKKIKCQLAIDHFGADPKPETLLKHLPVDYVKFDPALMSELSSKQKKQDQLNELNNLAISHNARTIAMGVEDANSLAILWTVGVNYIQGYFLQEPSESISYDFSSPN